MTAEATAELPKTVVLPEELIIEIISRVDSRNTLQLRPVCKRWNSLITDPEFVKKHFQSLFTDIRDLTSKALEQSNAFISQHNINNPVVPQEEGEENAEEEEEDEDVAFVDEEVVAAVDEEKDELKRVLMDLVSDMDNLLVNLRFIKDNTETIHVDMQTQSQALEDIMKCFRSFVRIYLK
ncbi:putative F-box domain-containing protein [Medicago truncatula]|nr:putative F-box/kelch-repeat protein At3g17570 [Medicago truncatula]ABN09766.1 Cyclin-like F-box [Medicago truncatula]AFK46573.1 unknown [Medicago truncatula]RHN72414.1 putative F-box domain-containing protein [Medicago truncatula]